MSGVHLALEDYPAAVADLERALEIYRDGGIMEGSFFYYLGLSQESAGDYQAAIASASRTLELQRDAGNPHGQMEALAYLAQAHHEAGEFEAAAASLERAMELSRRLAIPLGNGMILRPLNIARYRTRGTSLKSAASLKYTIHVYETLGLRWEEVSIRNARRSWNPGIRRTLTLSTSARSRSPPKSDRH